MPSRSTAEAGNVVRRSEGGGIAGTAFSPDTDIQRIRAGFEEHLRINFEETGLLSSAEAEAQRRYVEQALTDRANIRRLLEDYASPAARDAARENRRLYRELFLKPLREALEARVLSRSSYDAWVRWVHDETRGALEKKTSIHGALPAYLRERWELARERAKFLREPPLDDTAEPLRSELRSLRDERDWFGTLSFEQRKNLVGKVAARLKVAEGGAEHQKLFTQAEKMLQDATKTPQPALHRDKVGIWLQRIFESGASAEQIKAFLEGTGEGSLRKLIATWRAIALEFWILRKDEAFKGVHTSFINTKAFLWLHYDERTAYVAKMRAQVAEARSLRVKAARSIDRAAHALDEGGRARWMAQYIFNGKYTLEELKSIIDGNVRERLERKIDVLGRFERASGAAHTLKGIRGMPLPEKSTFLKLHYERQLVTVREMELRLDQVRRQKPDFLRIRHFMDREDWESALECIEEARKRGALSFEDDGQLLSMEHYIKVHDKEGERKNEGTESTPSEARQVDHLIESIGSPSLQHLCTLLAERGSESIGALGWTSYNRDWCNKNGYLSPEREYQAIRKGKAEALAKARRRKRGVVNENIQGQTGEEEYIELSRSAATNVCVDVTDSGAMHAFAETLYRRRKDHRALYWTNAIFHRGGVLMDLGEQNEETRRLYKIRILLRKLEAKNLHYRYRGA